MPIVMYRLFFILLLLVTTTSLHADDELAFVLSDFRRAIGGEYNLQRIKTLRVEGRILQNDRELKFILYKRRPNQLRREIEIEGDRRVVQLYDGRTAWQWNVPMADAGVVRLNEKQTALLSRSARFLGPLLEDGDKPTQLKLNEDLVNLEHYNSSLRLIWWETPEGLIEEFFIDSLKLEHICTRLKTADGTVRLTSYFSDFREIDRVRFPFRVENYIGGEFYSSTEIDDIKVNFSVFSFFFNRPAIK